MKLLKHHIGFFLLLAALNLVAGGIFVINTASGANSAWVGVPLDDTWIHFVYARNIAEHFLPYYNLGVMESGMTSPLWVVVQAVVFRVVPGGLSDPVLTTKVLGILLGIATSFVVYLLAVHVTGQRLVGLAVGLVVALEPFLVFGRVSGMEVVLFTCMAALAMLFFLRGSRLSLGIVLGLLPLARPEGLVVVVLVLGTIVAQRLLESSRGRRLPTKGEIRVEVTGILPVLLPVLAFVLLWAAYNLSINGTPYPNTYLVKGLHEPILFHLTNTGRIVEGYLAPLSYFSALAFLVTVPLIAIGSVVCVKRLGMQGLPLVLVPWGLLYSRSISAVILPGPWNFMGRRYLDPVIPLLVLLIVLGLHALYTYAASGHIQQQRWYPRYRRPLKVAIAITLVLISIAPFAGLVSQWRQLPSEYSLNTHDVQRVNVAMGHWVRDNLPAAAVIGVGDAGALKYFGDHETIDLVGLNAHEMIGRPATEIADSLQLDYIIIFRDQRFDTWPVAEEIYTINIGGTQILGGGEMVVYRMNWPPPPVTGQLIAQEDFDALEETPLGGHILKVAHGPVSWQSAGGNWTLSEGIAVEASGADQDNRVVVEVGNTSVILDTHLLWSGGYAGLVFRYADEENWQMAWYDGVGDIVYATLSDGRFREIRRVPFAFGPDGTGHDLRLVDNKAAGEVSLYVDGNRIFHVPNFEQTDNSMVGLFSRGQGNSRFDYLTISELELSPNEGPTSSLPRLHQERRRQAARLSLSSHTLTPRTDIPDTK